MVGFSEEDVRQLAAGHSYGRGLEYLSSVVRIRALPGGLVATVVGSEDHRVRLRLTSGLAAECDCPYGEEGNFCKHCVAVSLLVLRSGLPRGVTQGPAESDVRTALTSMPRADLERLVWEHANADPVLYSRLRTYTDPSFADEDEDDDY